MSGVPDDQALRAPNWIEALHESIASHSPGRSLPADVSTIEEFVEIRDCLTLLERARRSQSQPATAPRRIGRFEIVREVGRGGFGVVFAAIDPRVGRHVALKVPRPEVLVDATSRERFLREAKAAGGLAHPNLITIFEVGEDGPFCYIASALCEGPNLAQWLKERTDPVPMGQAVRLVRALSLGVAHAHARGVLHRDIKPSNVLLERPANDSGSNELEPRLTDFGLAKLVELADDHTRSGALLGTPSYMAPEQAEGRSRDVGEATDVYALGVILFELLTGRPPLRGESDVRTLQLVAGGDVPPPTRFRPGIPRHLESIVLKCLEREPARRYGSAQHLADDLERFLEGRPTLARPASLAEKLWKSARRRPALAAVYAVSCVAMTALASGGWWYSSRLSAALDEVDAQRLNAVQQRYVSSIAFADRAINRNDVQQANLQLSQWIPRNGQLDMRCVAWHRLWRGLHEEHLSLTGHTGEVYCVRYSIDGRWLATASQDQTVRIWDAATGECRHAYPGHQGEVNCVTFSHDGGLVASGGDDGKVRVLSTETGDTLWEIDAHQGSVFGVDMTANGLLATCGSDHTVKLWDTKSKTQVATLDGHTAAVQALSYSSSGKLLATASDDSSVRVWSVGTRKLTHLLQHTGPVNCLSFSDDAKRLVSGERLNALVRLWDVHSGQRIRVVSHHDHAIHAVRWEDPNHCAVATKDGAVVLIDVADSRIARRFLGHAGRVWSVDRSTDWSRLVTAGADGTVRIWNPRLHHWGHRLPARAVSLAGTPDGRAVAVGDDSGIIHVFDVASRSEQWTGSFDRSVIGDFDGDGRSDPGCFTSGVWQLRLSGRDRASPDSSEQVLEFGTREDLPVVGDWDGDGRDNVGRYRPTTGKWAFDLDGQGGKPERTDNLGTQDPDRIDAYCPVVGRWDGPDHDSIGLADFDPATSVWTFKLRRGDGIVVAQVPNGSPDWVPIGGGRLTGLPDGWGFLSQSGRWVATLPNEMPDASGQPYVVEPPSKFSAPDVSIEAATLEAAHDAVSIRGASQTVAISPQGDRAAVSYLGRSRFSVWDVRDSRRVATVGVDSVVRALVFSPDGHTLAAGAEDGELTLFDGNSIEQVGAFRAHAVAVRHIVYWPDGRFFATLGGSEIKLWNPDGHLLKTIDDAAIEVANCLTVSPGGDLLATGGQDRLVSVWDVQTGRKIAALASHTLSVNGVAFSPDDRCLASCSDDGSIRLWDTATWHDLYTFADQLQPVHGIVFAGDDLISAGGRLEEVPGALRFFSLGRAADATASSAGKPATATTKP